MAEDSVGSRRTKNLPCPFALEVDTTRAGDPSQA